MSRPRLLDLFCGAGGAAMGYHRAGFDVLGVDLEPQPNYPFPFVQADALDFMRELITFPRAELAVDAVHASPPCQTHSSLKTLWRDRDHPDLIEPTRELLVALGLPWIMENVRGAPMSALTLCGASFHLGATCRDGKRRALKRHRLFETSWLIMFPPSCVCDGSEPIGVYGHGGAQEKTVRNGGRNRGYMGTLAECREAMGIDWMTKAEISQAIPPAYTQWLGGELRQEVIERGGVAWSR